MDIQYWYSVIAKDYQPETHYHWIINNFGRSGWYVVATRYYFEKEEHAILFALHWS